MWRRAMHPLLSLTFEKTCRKESGSSEIVLDEKRQNITDLRSECRR